MKAAVVGSGAWGTALAVRLCKNGHDVTMWTYEKDKIPEMLETHHNPRLPAAVLPEALKISGDYDCVRGCKLVVMASPSFPLRAVSRGVAPYIDGDAVVVSVTKGLEQNTHMRMSQVVAQETGKNVVALTGPSHAEEVCINLPTVCWLPAPTRRWPNLCRTPLWQIPPGVHQPRPRGRRAGRGAEKRHCPVRRYHRRSGLRRQRQGHAHDPWPNGDRPTGRGAGCEKGNLCRACRCRRP